MSNETAPKLVKWPFVLADILLLGVAIWIVYKAPNPFFFGPLMAVIACTALGAWLCILPFLMQYKADIKFAESTHLISTVGRINDLRGFTSQIIFATGQWQVVQEQCAKTMNAAKEISERMASEAKGFADFMAKASDSERAHLRLEVEKLRRGEGESLQIMVRLLDHVYALYSAGVRSGQANLREQLTNFQNACRDSARRIGLVAFEAQPNEPFNEKTHQLSDPEAKPPEGVVVTETLATGFTFQGQLLRCAVVNVQLPDPVVEETSAIEAPEAPKPPEPEPGAPSAPSTPKTPVAKSTTFAESELPFNS